MTQHLRGDALGRGGGGTEVERIAGPLKRHRDARRAEQRALERAADGARVGDVVAEVVALVDARDDQVRQAREDVDDPQVHAVGRRAVDRVDALAQPLEPERTGDGQRVADRARLPQRGDDGDVADRAQRVRQRVQAFRVDTVVVGDENPGHKVVGAVCGRRRSDEYTRGWIPTRGPHLPRPCCRRAVRRRPLRGLRRTGGPRRHPTVPRQRAARPAHPAGTDRGGGASLRALRRGVADHRDHRAAGARPRGGAARTRPGPAGARRHAQLAADARRHLPRRCTPRGPAGC